MMKRSKSQEKKLDKMSIGTPFFDTRLSKKGVPIDTKDKLRNY